VVLNSNSI